MFFGIFLGPDFNAILDSIPGKVIAVAILTAYVLMVLIFHPIEVSLIWVPAGFTFSVVRHSRILGPVISDFLLCQIGRIAWPVLRKKSR